MTVKTHTVDTGYCSCSNGNFWIILPIVRATEEALQRLPVPR